MIAIGSHEDVLWVVLPFAVLLGSYAPRAISFAAGQAGFTVVLFVLFNIIQPVGWRVGLVRIEDVAIGFAISLGSGSCSGRAAPAPFSARTWPSPTRNADYVVAAERELVADGAQSRARRGGRRPPTRRTASTTPFASTSPNARHRPTAARASTPLVAGAVASPPDRTIALVARAHDRRPRAARACGANLDAEVHALRAWYVTLGDAIVR